jgi:hypothetical protein
MTLCERETTAITFSVPPGLGGQHAELLGEFVSWAPLAMDRHADGRFSIVLHLEPGRSWRYRFLIDGDRLMNDPAAEWYEPFADGGAISVMST